MFSGESNTLPFFRRLKQIWKTERLTEARPTCIPDGRRVAAYVCVNLACTSSIILQSHNTADAHLLIIRSPIFPQVFPFLFLLIRVLTSYNFRVYSVTWSPDGKQIASGSFDETIKIWDSQSGDCQSTQSQGRLAIARSRVPNLDVSVIAGAYNLLSVGAPRHWSNSEIARSQHPNQQK